MLDRLEGKSNEQFIIRLDRIAQMVRGLVFRTTHMFSLPSVNFSALMSKWSFAVYILIRFIGQVLALTLLTLLAVALRATIGLHQPLDVLQLVQGILFNPIYQVVVLILVFVNGRTVLFRMDDKETLLQR